MNFKVPHYISGNPQMNSHFSANHASSIKHHYWCLPLVFQCNVFVMFTSIYQTKHRQLCKLQAQTPDLCK